PTSSATSLLFFLVQSCSSLPHHCPVRDEGKRLGFLRPLRISSPSCPPALHKKGPSCAAALHPTAAQIRVADGLLLIQPYTPPLPSCSMFVAHRSMSRRVLFDDRTITT
ncbi:hypothetical protein EJB05_05263, partial [Eragrostis curvula]